MDVGSNVLQAASRTVSKDKANDPGAVIEVCRIAHCFILLK
jgi:hypothetical protein